MIAELHFNFTVSLTCSLNHSRTHARTHTHVQANIFAVEPRTLYTSSPRADREARKGLGGAQGLGIAVGLIGVVAAATIGVGFLQGEDGVGTLGYEGGETLQDIAARM